MLQRDSPALQRAAAEALGRIGDRVVGACAPRLDRSGSPIRCSRTRWSMR